MPRYIPVITFFLLAYYLWWFGLPGNHLWPSDDWPVPMNPLGGVFI